LTQANAQTAESIIRTALEETAAVALDAKVFSADAASASAPAGLLNGVTPIAATAGGGVAAMVGDLKLLAGALADNGAGTSIMIFANPRQAIALEAQAAPGFTAEVVATPALASGTIVAIEAGAIAYSIDDVPQIDLNKGALYHEDTAPSAIGTAGSPNVVAAPTRSLWQTDCVALRLIWPATWATRAPGMVQVINSTTW
jgi:hypothetical protein